VTPCQLVDAALRPCRRPPAHEGPCGDLRSERVRVARPLQEYLSKRRPNGTPVLEPVALEALGDARSDHRDPALIVMGEQRREDGELFLDYAVTVEHIERVSGFRYHDDSRRFRLFCTECGLWDGKHGKTCGRG
jgi:hypothetical protein